MKILMTGVYVNNVEKAFTFYTEILDFVEKMYVPEASLAIVAAPEDPDGTSLLLEPIENPLARNYQKRLYDAGLPAIVFGVEDLQYEYERLNALGVIFRKEPIETEYGIEALIEDTCGNLIQIHQV